MNFVQCLHSFFHDYLPKIKGVSDNTVKGYRDAFKIFLLFASEHHQLDIKSLQLQHLSTDLIMAFLEYLESERHNGTKTRNLRLAALKSLAKMIRLLYPEHRDVADRIQNLPQKRAQKKLVGYFHPDEILQIFQSVDLKKAEGFRDYTLLHLLFDSGARASEVATLNLDYFDQKGKTLSLLGKGDRYRLIDLWPKTVDLLKSYINDHRVIPKVYFAHRLFVNQRGEEFTRHGINKICKKHLSKTFPSNRLLTINPAHSFRHSCVMNMLASGHCLTDIKNRLGHENIQSTMNYLKLDLSRKREVQKKFIQYTQAIIGSDPKLDEMIDWDSKEKIFDWLDSL